LTGTVFAILGSAKGTSPLLVLQDAKPKMEMKKNDAHLIIEMPRT